MKRLSSVTLGCVFLAGACLARPAAADPKPRTAAAPDSTRADSMAVAAEAAEAAVPADSSRAASLDPAYAWKGWQELSRAIELRPLDGPEDILEKVEIIHDRVDALRREGRKLEGGRREWMDREAALGAQVEILDDMARVQRGGDLQLQQRVHTLREDGREASRRILVLDQARRELRAEVLRLEGVAGRYEEAAETLRRREEEKP